MPIKGDTKVSPQLLSDKADQYIEKCTKDNKVPLLVEFCFMLGIGDETLRRYSKKTAYVGAIKRVEKAQEIALLSRGINDNKPVFPIFLLKSKHGYIEQQKLDISTNGKDLGVVMLPPKAT